MPVGWWESVKEGYLLRCALDGKEPDPEWLAAWEKGGVLW